jgi:Flp pilus assembly protein TadG
MIKRPLVSKTRRGAQSGATAVEFAMVAGPLFLMIMATLELAMVFVVSTMLESALSKAAREIRTGQQQGSADASEGAFVSKVCSAMVFLKDSCEGQLTVDVRGTDGFSSAGAPDPVTGGAQMTFEPGGPGQIVLVRAFYRWPLFTPFLSQALSKVGDNTALITAADTFRNEPFTPPAPAGGA